MFFARTPGPDMLPNLARSQILSKIAYMKQFLCLPLFLLAPALAHTQAISINTDASTPHPSAILDVKSFDCYR